MTNGLASENERLRSSLDRKNRYRLNILDCERAVASSERFIELKTAELKEAKAAHDKAVNRLREAVCSDPDQLHLPLPFAQDQSSHGPVQQNLQQKPEIGQQAPKEPEKPPTVPVEDKHAKTPLTQIGLTPPQCDKLAGLEPAVETVGDLEALIAAGRFVKGSVKGLGEVILNKISDKLIAFRQKYPSPKEQRTDLVDGLHDPSAYHAGAIARADGRPVTENPHQGTFQGASWDAGWHAKDKEIMPPAAFGEGVEKGQEATNPTPAAKEPGLPATPPETVAIPITSVPGVEVLVDLEHHPDLGGFRALITAAVPDGISMRQVEEGPDSFYPQRDDALRNGLNRLREWFTQRVPDVGETVAAEIQLYADKVAVGGQTDTAEDSTRAEQALDTCENVLSDLYELEGAENVPIDDLLILTGEMSRTQELICKLGRVSDAQVQVIDAAKVTVAGWKEAATQE